MTLFNAIDALVKLKEEDLQIIAHVLAKRQKTTKVCVVCGERVSKRNRLENYVVRTCLWQDSKGVGCRRMICATCVESTSKWVVVCTQEGVTYGSYDIRCDIHSHNTSLFNILYYQLKIDSLKKLNKN
jgi:hypothetical protein